MISGERTSGQSGSAWWRVNTMTGATDARFSVHGNAANMGIYTLGSTGSLVAGEGGSHAISIAEQAGLSSNSQQNAYRILNEASRLRKKQEAQAIADAANKRKARNEYLIVLSVVVIASTVAYAMLSESNVNAIVKATYGEQ